MLALGKINRLSVKKQVKFGFYLDGLSWGEILLPNNVVPANLEIGQELDVFLYLDSEDQLIATTERPKIKAGEVAYLPVVAVTKVGAFVDWGLKKDLLVPFSEQQIPLKEGQKYLLYCYVDVSNRIVASTKLDRHIHKTPANYNVGDRVDFIKRYVFPGGSLPSVSRMTQAVTQQTDMIVRHLQDIGFDYAKTLKDWRNNFMLARDNIHQLGFDDKFIRLWHFYLCYCEGGFLERATSAVHLVLTKPANRSYV